MIQTQKRASYGRTKSLKVVIMTKSDDERKKKFYSSLHYNKHRIYYILER